MSSTDPREAQWERSKRKQFDVLIIGGGISGACLFHHLSTEGYRVLLVEQGDFASGTSQSSTMMIWGGLLYLKDLRFPTVWRLCGSRNRLLSEKSNLVRPQQFRYLLSRNGSRGKLLLNTALHAYWMFGRCRGALPRSSSRFSESSFLDEAAFRESFVYEEAVLDHSDSRFVLHWVLAHQSEETVALNHCALTGMSFNETAGSYNVLLEDKLRQDHKSEVRARLIVNCCGPWADLVNARFGISSPFRHILSKGVFIGVRRFPDHELPLIVDVGDKGDCMSLIPWGPISLWGPTEAGESPLTEAHDIKPEDVTLLLNELNRILLSPQRVEDIVSLRCGVRALVVRTDTPNSESTLELSRKFEIYCDENRPWISVYGGKLTDCVRLARMARRKIKARIGSGSGSPRIPLAKKEPEKSSFPGLLEPTVDVNWCVNQEMCFTLEDYLRRRTNIAQWVPRGGLGWKNENRNHLKRIAEKLPTFDQSAEEHLRLYESKVVNQIDSLLSAVEIG
ncbi:MAG: FAD-dependent oxidoreductase [Pyrinomonadaceae bacterium]